MKPAINPIGLFLAILFTFLLFGFGHPQDDQKGLARVSTIEGHEVYVLCKPLREYVVMQELNGFNTTAGGKSVKGAVESFVWKANRKKLDYDAILIDDGFKAQMIKFK